MTRVLLTAPVNPKYVDLNKNHQTVLEIHSTLYTVLLVVATHHKLYTRTKSYQPAKRKKSKNHRKNKHTTNMNSLVPD